MAKDTEFTNATLRRYLAFIIALLAGLLILLLAYYMLTKPPVSEGAKVQKDFTHLFSIYGFEGDLLNRPSGVAIDDQGQIYVADTGKHRIVVFDRNGNYVTQFGEKGDSKFQIKNPIGVAVAPDGRIYVLTKSLKKIVIYDPQRKPVREIKFDWQPTSLIVHDNRLYVTTRRGVMIGDLDGRLLSTFGKWGKAPGEFDLPGGIVVADDGKIYVADSLNYRVQALTKDGKPIWQYGKPLPESEAIQYRGSDRKFGLPASIALDQNGHLYVVDGLSSEIVVLDANSGKYVRTIGDIGQDDGFFYYPDGIAYAGGGTLVVADKFNDRVQVFRVPMALTPFDRFVGWLPYALIILALPILWLLLRPKLRVVASRDFLERALRENYGDEIAAAFSKLYVLPATLSALKETAPSRLKLVERLPLAEEAEKIAKEFSLDREDAAALALAKRMRGKRVLLAEKEAVREVAEKLDLVALSVDEFVEMLREQTSGRAVEGEA